MSTHVQGNDAHRYQFYFFQFFQGILFFTFPQNTVLPYKKNENKESRVQGTENSLQIDRLYFFIFVFSRVDAKFAV